MLPGLFRTLVGLIVAWFVFRFLDRMFGGRRRPSRGPGAGSQAGWGAGARGGADGRSKAAKDDHLGEYVDYEEVEEGKD